MPVTLFRASRFVQWLISKHFPFFYNLKFIYMMCQFSPVMSAGSWGNVNRSNPVLICLVCLYSISFRVAGRNIVSLVACWLRRSSETYPTTSHKRLTKHGPISVLYIRENAPVLLALTPGIRAHIHYCVSILLSLLNTLDKNPANAAETVDLQAISLSSTPRSTTRRSIWAYFYWLLPRHIKL